MKTQFYKTHFTFSYLIIPNSRNHFKCLPCRIGVNIEITLYYSYSSENYKKIRRGRHIILCVGV